MSDFEKKLDEMNQNWGEGKDTPPGPPDGTYAMQLQNCEIREAQTSGKLYIAREHLVIDGEFEGEVVRDMMSLETDRGPYFISRWIDQMGYESPDKASDLPETLEAIKNDAPTYTASLKHSGDFINVRVQEVLDSGKEPAKPEDEVTPTAKKVEGGSKSIELGTRVKFEDEDGNEIIGKVVNNSDDAEIHVENDKEELYGAALTDLTVVDGATDGGEEDNLVSLLTLAQSCEVEGLSDDMSLEDLIKTLQGYEWDANELLEEEVKLLTDNKVEVKGAKKTATKVKPKPKPKKK